ncbi:uncharacterized protein LOC108888033 isoform X1 [Lates calcarifer]|uniref:Uncharacterized protein LOC108888033 isoform X1 n=2 Tax=Lates calcarifer TaxID=8187 RepID=A0AAJ7PV13_LATCA|nr:uncharacterized protein LOC108888033 isoform X1 [Lates calcarifer]XP_050930114.1 uncharacterized protein LOC108888033 isoform X1 [Lates calcarifer]
MDTLSTYFVEETKCMRGRDEEEEEEEEEEDSGDEEDKEEEKYDSQNKELAAQAQQKPAWAPCFFYRTDKEVYYYVGQEITIEGAFDSYAGMIWPAALALSHYLDTHREQLNLEDKAVLELGAGTGLVSVVAALLGAWVTASDLPEVLNNLRVNLSRNTRGRCKHTPQVAALSWDYNLERSYPTSVYRYDYVLGTDVVYHHDFLDELLATMKHFCRPGTTLIWANKVRMESDLTFTENFKKAFHTSLLAEDGDMKIYMATCREEEGEGDKELEIQDVLREEEERKNKENEEKLVEEKHNEDKLHSVTKEKSKAATEVPHMSEAERGDDKEEKNEHECDEDEEMEETVDEYKEDEQNKPENNDSNCSNTASDDNSTAAQRDRTPAWVPRFFNSLDKDVYHYVGHDIVIYESIDSYGAVMWPAALALCSFLDNNREKVNLQGKEVLELGAGTGLVAVVASLLGASVTATDLPEVLSNLRANVMRNTRGRCTHMPKVEALSWGYDLERTHPTSVYRYDYVLAADVVYHHDFLDELLATMKHFCRPGTTVIWANKVRMVNDVTFTENFKKAFHTSLLAEDGDMKIYMATCRE